MVSDFLKDLAITTGGAVIGLLVDQAVGIAWVGAGLPMVGLGSVHADDALLMLSEGLGAYWTHTKKMTDVRNFLLGMFGVKVAMEVYEGLIDAGIIAPYIPPPPAVARAYVAPSPVRRDHVRYIITT